MKDSSTEVHLSSVSADSSEALEDSVILNKSYRKVDVRLLTFYAIVAMLMKIESHNITNAKRVQLSALYLRTDINAFIEENDATEVDEQDHALVGDHLDVPCCCTELWRTHGVSMPTRSGRSWLPFGSVVSLLVLVSH
jgi:hypothetical protein